MVARIASGRCPHPALPSGAPGRHRPRPLDHRKVLRALPAGVHQSARADCDRPRPRPHRAQRRHAQLRLEPGDLRGAREAGAVAALADAVQIDVGDATHRSASQEAASAIQGRSAEDERGSDGALQRARRQSDGRLLAAADPVADPVQLVPSDQHREGPVRARRLGLGGLGPMPGSRRLAPGLHHALASIPPAGQESRQVLAPPF